VLSAGNSPVRPKSQSNSKDRKNSLSSLFPRIFSPRDKTTTATGTTAFDEPLQQRADDGEDIGDDGSPFSDGYTPLRAVSYIYQPEDSISTLSEASRNSMDRINGRFALRMLEKVREEDEEFPVPEDSRHRRDSKHFHRKNKAKKMKRGQEMESNPRDSCSHPG
jgi:hypothetical protein